MEERFSYHPEAVKGMTTADLRNAFLMANLMQPGQLKLVYTHYDRMIVGGAVPSNAPLTLAPDEALKSSFLERRELGLINIGGRGTATADGVTYVMEKLDCLYLGRGTRDITLQSEQADHPAQYFLLSAPAHQTYPAAQMKNAEATPAEMGARQTANERTIFKYIHVEGIRSCQLVMGLTVLKEGSVWNTMPAHTHHRRMEAYLYFDLAPEHRVVHFMGTPQETRHLLMAAGEAVVSPPWSVHSGCGTASYSFIWGMAGENQSFADMDFIPITDLR